MNEEADTSYIIQQGAHSERVRGRDAAVSEARRWSATRKFRPVQLERDDQRRHVVSREGELDNSVLELK